VRVSAEDMAQSVNGMMLLMNGRSSSSSSSGGGSGRRRSRWRKGDRKAGAVVGSKRKVEEERKRRAGLTRSRKSRGGCCWQRGVATPADERNKTIEKETEIERYNRLNASSRRVNRVRDQPNS
jgi:hypothetical protein